MLRHFRPRACLRRPSQRRRRGLATIAPHVAISPLDPGTPLDYASRVERLRAVSATASRPLTLSEKLLYSHLIPSEDQPWRLDEIRRGSTILQLRPDRVACHDATATMALLQFISAGLPRVRTPTTVHSDHLIVAEHGADSDMKRALSDHREVYEFLSSAAKKYGIGFHKPGSGIIHITIFENYAFPGGLIIGTDSHTPNAGGLGMLGIGVGGADAVDAMAGMPWELACPKVVGVRLTGRLHGWTSAKDIICTLAGILTVSGGKGKIIEFFGPGTESLSATAMATVCNMSAEVGSTSCVFPYTPAMARYLEKTKRADIAREADAVKPLLLEADAGSDRYYDEVIEIDLDTLEPHINGPFTPDLSHPLSTFKDAVRSSPWPRTLSHAMVGSCTNSSYEDLRKVQQLVGQARREGGIEKVPVPFLVSPGSEQIRATAEAEGILQDLRDAGAVVLSSSCGPCVGQWDRTDVDVRGREPNSVISSYNRNFAGRHDSNPATHSFVTSPEMVVAFAYSGRLDFNPATDAIPNAEQEETSATTENTTRGFRFTPPASFELPSRFSAGEDRFQAPLADGSAHEVAIDPNSDRLQLLQPFAPWQPGQAADMHVLIKVCGKCTTDHISPAGPWYKYRGHLENISNNMLLGASNAFFDEADGASDIATTAITKGLDKAALTGHTIHPVTGKLDLVHSVARQMRDARPPLRWCIVADWNYGEGSSREHAALEPRYLGGTAVIARSFARIHETNLKKQGMLPLTFADPADYDRIRRGDVITLRGVEEGELRPGSTVTMVVQPAGEGAPAWTAPLHHSFYELQLRWLRAGSALNYIKSESIGRGGL